MRISRLTVVVMFASAVFAQNAPAPLTLHDALQLMRANNIGLASARLHAKATTMAEITASLRPNPVLSSANEDFNVFNPAHFDINNQEFTQSVGFTVERGGKRAARIASAKLGSVVANDQFADNQRQAEFQVRNLFVTLLAAKDARRIAQENLSDYQRSLDANHLRLQSGDISQTEFDRSKLEEARFQNDLIAAESAERQARVQLEAAIGVPDSPSFSITGSLSPPATSFDLSSLRDLALSNRPDLKAASDSVTKAQADVRLAHANGAADLTVAPEYKRNGRDNTVGVTLQVPLRFFDRNQGEKARTRYEEQASQFAARAARLQVEADVAQAYEAYSAALRRVQLYSTEYLNTARDVRDRTAFSYEHGHSNLLDYLDALRSYRDVASAAVNANAQLWTAIHQLSYVTGAEVLP